MAVVDHLCEENAARESSYINHEIPLQQGSEERGQERNVDKIKEPIRQHTRQSGKVSHMNWISYRDHQMFVSNHFFLSQIEFADN